MSRFNWQEMSPEERDAFDRWLPEWQERQRKRGAYWLTPEGRAEIAETWENDADSVPRVLLDALERAEAALATASRERDEVLHQLALAEDARERTQREAHERAAEMGAALAAATREGDEARLALRARLNEAPLVYEAQRALATATRESDEARAEIATLHERVRDAEMDVRIRDGALEDQTKRTAAAESALAAAREREAELLRSAVVASAIVGALLDGCGVVTITPDRLRRARLMECENLPGGGVRLKPSDETLGEYLARTAAAASPDATTKTKP